MRIYDVTPAPIPWHILLATSWDVIELKRHNERGSKVCLMTVRALSDRPNQQGTPRATSSNSLLTLVS
jgi:hypothetical protein